MVFRKSFKVAETYQQWYFVSKNFWAEKKKGSSDREKLLKL